MIRAYEQSKRTMCIALYNRELNRSNICPANHEVDYGHGWFYFDHGKDDGRVFHRPDLTGEAEQKLAEGYEILYWPEGNTYVLGECTAG